MMSQCKDIEGFGLVATLRIPYRNERYGRQCEHVKFLDVKIEKCIYQHRPHDFNEVNDRWQ
jgi:hypothetical protein